MVYKIRKFTDSIEFANAVKVTIAAAIPVILFSWLGDFKTGFAIALGAFLTSPSDISSNLTHKVNGLLSGAFIVAGSALLVSIVYPYPWLFYPVFVGLLFFLSMISVYGYRATNVSFSGLLSVSLVFSTIYSGRELYEHCGLMLAGGLFYFLVSMAFWYVRPNRYAEKQLYDCIRLTSKYLKLRGDLWTVGANREKIIEKQLELQVELNTIHEHLREALINSRLGSGPSNQNRKMLIVFISLLEILELALSTSFDHGKLHEKFKGHENVLATYQQLAYNLASTLKKLAKSIENRSKYTSGNRLFDDLAALEKAIEDYEKELGHDAAEGVYLLRTMHHYAEKQVEKINIAERALTLAVFKHDFKGADKDLEKFLKPQYYPISTFTENLSFSSTIFRHSLRLTVTMLFGFIIGQLLPFQNAYWILLTIVVIMRPGYGLTKERSYHRIFGTILGGLLAFGLLSVMQNDYVISGLAVLSMILGFAFTTTNYKVGATFVTMYVVFIYGLQTPHIQDVVQYRILDTVAGAALAFMANHFFWPTWEFLSVPSHTENAVKANRDYLREISELYNKKGEIPVSYRLARKEAFIEIGNLMASFQRMAQEPKSKQKSLQQVYKLAVMNHTLLSSLASLGTYIQSYKTSKASAGFNAIVDTAIANLNDALTLLKDEPPVPRQKEDLSLRFTELRNIRAKELAQSKNINEASFKLKMQEAQLVIEQLVWLTNMTENILKAVQSLKSHA
ncbi:Integral membrane protein YccS N-terminal domain-containing protein [Flavobacterium longum]|uniref:FUSC family membrane protein n=1 Tax=Flavobacterium longum TaxID=1299340 RepID=UPI0039EC060A